MAGPESVPDSANYLGDPEKEYNASLSSVSLSSV